MCVDEVPGYVKLLLVGGHPRVHASHGLLGEDLHSFAISDCACKNQSVPKCFQEVPRMRDNACRWFLILPSDLGINAFALKGTFLHQSLPTEKLSFLDDISKAATIMIWLFKVCFAQEIPCPVGPPSNCG